MTNSQNAPVTIATTVSPLMHSTRYPSSDVVPMPSARIGNGRYAVLGTSHGVDCVRRGREWWLLVNAYLGDGDDARIGPFPTKRAALQFCQKSVEL